MRNHTLLRSVVGAVITTVRCTAPMLVVVLGALALAFFSFYRMRLLER